jgi:hypothetical protein
MLSLRSFPSLTAPNRVNDDVNDGVIAEVNVDAINDISGEVNKGGVK